MTTYSSERTIIESRFNSLFTLAPIKWENVDYNPTPGTSFVELIIDTDNTEQIEITSNPTYRIDGSILCIVYTPVNAGSAASRTILDSIRSIFVGQTFSGITCRNAMVGKAGIKDEWYRTLINIEFFYDSRLS